MSKGNAGFSLARIAILSLFGALISIYLIYHHVQVNGGYQLGPSVCNIGGDFNCDDVARSSYSQFYGVPVASYGLVFYGLALLFLGLIYWKERELDESSSIGLISILGLVGLIPSLALFLVSWLLIQKWCLFCALLYVVNLFIFVLSWRWLFNTPSVLSSLGGGVRGGMALAFKSPTALLFWPLSLFLLGTGLYLPKAFEDFVFKPAISEMAIEQLYGAWSKAKKHEIPIDLSDDPILKDYSVGHANAKVTVVEFSDFECPYCQRAAGVLKPFFSKTEEPIRLVFKDYPLDSLCNPALARPPHELACQAAIMARCAGGQGEKNFWKMHDLLFELTPEDWTQESLSILPKELNLDRKRFDLCVSSPEMLRRVRDNVQVGDSVGVTYTPSIYINGRKVEPRRLDQIPRLVNRILRDEES